eukprot:COSAG02_NODE_1883_length_10535_cov_4.902070_10_plen_480_part_00
MVLSAGTLAACTTCMGSPISGQRGVHTQSAADTAGGVDLSATSMPKPKSLDEPFLFMDEHDVQDAWGLMWPKASTLAPDPQFRPPPLPYSSGATVVSVIPATDFNVSGEYEVYASNTTGWEPLAQPDLDTDRGAELEPEPEQQDAHPKYPECGRKRSCPVSLLRYTTKDFTNYSPPHLSLFIPDDPVGSGGTPTVKSIARNDHTGLYVLFACYMGSCEHTFTSTNAGLSWNLCNITGVTSPDKDDLNIVFNDGHFVDMQIVWQTWAMKYCDNGGCNRRRVISAKTSSNGADWSEDLGLYTPDSLDPPELQFYRIRPFYIGNTTRLAAHVLQYAPAPSQAQLGVKYGRQPSMCSDDVPPQGQGAECHGPHLYEEWWVGPTSGRAVDVAGWRRPYRHTHAAPHDAFLMAPPVPFDDRLLWIGSTGSAYSLPSYRIAGMYAPANGEFNTPAFAYPATGLFINADVKWKGGTVTGACDEGCNA